jgi:hypothetical protein
MDLPWLVPSITGSKRRPRLFGLMMERSDSCARVGGHADAHDDQAVRRLMDDAIPHGGGDATEKTRILQCGGAALLACSLPTQRHTQLLFHKPVFRCRDG